MVGNLNKFAVVPPGHTGRPKKGHLIFDACFESGEFVPCGGLSVHTDPPNVL